MNVPDKDNQSPGKGEVERRMDDALRRSFTIKPKTHKEIAPPRKKKPAKKRQAHSVMLSKRKLESYKRAEVVAQAARKYLVSGHRWTQAELDNFTGAVLDWLAVTGKVKFNEPVRRGRDSKLFRVRKS